MIDLRAAPRLRGAAPIEPAPAIESLLAELAAAQVDLARTRLVCDWIQYRANFRTAVALRPVLADAPPSAAIGAAGSGPGPGPGDGGVPATAGLEVAVDLRRGIPAELGTELKRALAADPAGSAPPPGVLLEP